MKNRLRISLIITNLIIAILIVFLFSYIKGEETVDKVEELKQELIEASGSYDPQQIILQNTNKKDATEIAKKLNAKLRISYDGKFATLTLPMGINITDVVNDPNYKEIAGEFSIDYEVSTSEIEEENNDKYTPKPSIVTPNDDLYKYQTYLDYLNLSNIWEITKGEQVTLAVIDTGIDTDHPEFEGKISEYSYNASEDKIVKDYLTDSGEYDWSLVEDEVGHGTAVTGVIAAKWDNGGIVGIAPDVNILTIKAECDEDGTFKRSSDLVFGLYYAIERNAKVINMSFGTLDNIFSDATSLAVDNDIICVAAAGNESTAALTYPAADPNVIGVGALADNSFELSYYSNYGENTDIVAPGTTYTTKMGGGYCVMNGTSFASPIVASIIALQISKEDYNYFEFANKCELLFASSMDLGPIGKDFYYGYGLIDTSAFILEARYTVTFNYLTDEIDNTRQVFIKDHPLQTIPEPERNYAIFDGWYYDIHCNDELTLYEDSWDKSLTLYCSWIDENKMGDNANPFPYTYKILKDGTVEITGYTGKRNYITLPERIEGKVVSSIGENAFKRNYKLKMVNLPSKLKIIKKSAFEGCTSLNNIDIPDTVTTIEECAFNGAVRLMNVTFSNNSKLEILQKDAFSGCSQLSRIDLPKNVIYDEELEYCTGSSFIGCTNLKQVNAHKQSKYFINIKGVLYNKSITTLVLHPANLKLETFDLPNSVNKLGNGSFAFTSIKHIDLNKVTYIGKAAFSNSKLKEIEKLEKVTYIGDYAFSGTYINDITLGNNLTSINNGVFSNTRRLHTLYIPNNIKTIGQSSFYGSTIRNIIFTDDSKLEIIGKNAFEASAIDSINLPDSLIRIEERAFTKSLLKEINISLNSNLVFIGEKAFADTLITKINLPKKLITVNDFAFENSDLKEITIPASLINYHPNVFYECHKLENIFIDNNNEKYIDVDGVVYTKDLKTLYQYPAGKDLTSYTILDDVLKIGEYAFSSSWNLQEVIFSSSIEEISDYAFYECENITNYTLSTSLELIGEYAFSYNKSLESINIPDNVIQIKKRAFYKDNNLIYINFTENSKLSRLSYEALSNCGISMFEIPSNVSTIGQKVFDNCTNLTTVTFAKDSKLTSITSYLFEGCNSLQYIYFKEGSKLETIQTHAFDGLSRLISIDFADAKLKNIGNYSFRYCENLTSIVIPNSVEYIGRYAFYGCKSLEEIVIPENVKYIGRYSFHFTNNLQVFFDSAVLPLGVEENWDYGINGYYVGVTETYQEGDFTLVKLTNGTIGINKYTGSDTFIDLNSLNLGIISQIGGHAFEYSNVTEVVLPNSVISIDRYAFANSKITKISIPDNVQQISEYAFYNSNISDIKFSENSNLIKIGKYAFSQTTELKQIKLPKSLQYLETYAFFESGLEELTFEDNSVLNTISENAFNGSKLVNISIPDSVILIDHNAFRNISTLENVSLPNNELKIMSNVFYNTGLTNVNIPEKLVYIGEYAFVGLKNLTEFVVDENNKYYASKDGVLYNKDYTKLISFPGNKEGNFVIPNTVEILGFGAFENSKLEKLEFEEGTNLSTIALRSFYNMVNLKKIDIPKSVVSINYYAFAMCKSLETINFASDCKLTGIYEGAFYGCINLKNIIIPEFICEISDYAFSGCLSLTNIPILENNKLLHIGDYAFANSGLEEVNLPKGLLSIGDYAFKGTKVTEIIVPSDNQKELEIGIGAFNECNQLEEITLPFIGNYFDCEEFSWIGYVFGAGGYLANNTYIPDSLKYLKITEGTEYIYSHSFYGIQKDLIVDLPKSITYIGTYAFDDSTFTFEFKSPITLINPLSSGLENTLGEGIRGTLHIESILELGFTHLNISRGKFDLLIFGEQFKDYEISIGGDIEVYNIVLPENTEYCNFIFVSDKLNTITLPSSLKGFGPSFDVCYPFKKIINNSDLKLDFNTDKIAHDALEIVNKDGSIQYNDPNVKLVEYNDYIFKYNNGKYCLIGYKGKNTSITLPDFNSYDYDIKLSSSIINKIVIPGSKKNISNGAFQFTDNLNEVEIEYGVESIGDDAFSYTDIKEIIMPDTIKNLGNGVFIGCDQLEKIVLSQSITSIPYNFAYDCQSLKQIVIPDNITTIGAFAFSGCTNLEFNTDFSNVKHFDSKAFDNCEKLLEVTINKDADFNTSTFNNCTNLVLNISEDNPIYRKIDDIVYNIRDRVIAFVPFNISGKIELPKYVDDGIELIAISENSFENRKLLKEIVLPNSIVEIYNNAFYNCTGLERIILPDSLTLIGSAAFANCISLSEINIPTSVNRIEDSAFENCVSLESIVIPDSVTDLSMSLFKGCSNLVNVEFSDNITYIPSSLFTGCTSLQNFVIPENVTSIGSHAFENCTNLIEIKIPESVTLIQSYAFSNCIKLRNIELTDNINEIQSGVFSNCTSLQSVTLPKNLTKINPMCFSDCISLKSIELHNNITYIAYYAFSGCSGLVEVKIPSSVALIDISAFSNCRNLEKVEICEGVKEIRDYVFYDAKIQTLILPSTIEKIGYLAFDASIGTLYNNSNFDIGFENNDWGFKCNKIILPNDTIYVNPSQGEWIDYYYVIKDNFKFQYYVMADNYVLVDYVGDEKEIVLPADINGYDYRLRFRNSIIEKITFPDGKTSMNNHSDGCFASCTGLKVVDFNDIINIESFSFIDCISLNTIIADNVEEIENSAFFRCSSLTEITLPKVKKIYGNAFGECYNLAEVNCFKCSIAHDAFKNTKIYNNEDNWINGSLYINNNPVVINKDIFEFVVNDEFLVGHCAFDNCLSLKKLTLDIDLDDGFYDRLLVGDNYGVATTNLETIILNGKINSSLYRILAGGYTLPPTIKSIILDKETIILNSDIFNDFNDVKIFVNLYENEVSWDHDYPNWNNRNQVYYKGEWIETKFFDYNGELISNEYYGVNDVIRQPIINSFVKDGYLNSFIGWDINNDGSADSFPASSNIDIEAKAVYKKELMKYNVTFYDKDNKTVLYQYEYNFGDNFILPESPVKKGYEFDCWVGYPDDLKVYGNTNIYSSWKHLGDGHKYDTIETIKPSCTEEGYIKHICEICGEWYATDFVAKLEHNYVSTLINPTCTEEGYVLYQCECGDSYRSDITEALGHNYNEYIIDVYPTCQTEGSKHRICDCGHIEYEIIEQNCHEYETIIIKEPTCNQPGSIKYTCKICSTYYEESIYTDDHNFQKKYVSMNWILQLMLYISNVFYGVENELPYYLECADCGEIYTVNYTNKSTNVGVKNVCLHNNMTDWCYKVNPTCLEKGIKVIECLDCNQIIKFEIENTIEHDYISKISLPTCTDNGYTTFICSNCNHSYTDNYTNALGHSYGEVVYTWSEDYNTLTAKRVCLNDSNHYDTETVTTTYSVINNPTCVTDGLGKYTSNEFTNNIFSFQTVEVVIEKLGHDLTNHECKKPTCTESGWNEYDTCSRCDYTTYSELKALGHNESEWIIDKEATTESTGKKHTECKNCKEIIKTEDIPMIEKSGCGSFSMIKMLSIINLLGLVMIIRKRFK